YNMAAFQALRDFFKLIPALYEDGDFSLAKLEGTLHESLLDFLEKNNFEKAWQEIKANTASFEAFQKRFYGWFNGFRIIKFLKGSHPEYFEKVGVEQGAGDLLLIMKNHKNFSLEQLLLEYRAWDKNPGAYLRNE
ncbi:MAG: hypothetical protein ACOC0C_08915, partial [Bacteroidota bacterium]